MTTNNLLVELFVEELPPKALKKLGIAFSTKLFESLKAQGLAREESSVTPYASPRRLAAHITQIAIQAADKPISHKLMPVSVGLDANGQPTQALLKRLASMGLDAGIVSQLKREGEGKAEALFFDTEVQGATLANGLQQALEAALTALPIPKVMTYQLADGWSTVNFVRPAHGLIALHGANIVPLVTLGLSSGRMTRGHRFEAATAAISIQDADSYESQMESEGAVIPSFEKRRAEIVRQLLNAAAKVGNVKPIEDDALLDEVTALVERPNVLAGQFEEEFLDVPQECLILTMKANQKYFPLLDAAGKLTNQFLIVSNIRPSDPSAVIGGNERVVRPRLADAKFFFDQDRKNTLESRVLSLAKVVYHNRLGSQGERVQRVCAIAKAIGQQLDGEALALQAEQAALLAKADLLTDMVGEFPELQGIMGRYYALHDGLAADIADAIEDHYKPRFAGDSLPRGQVGTVVALADKLETLAGMFGIGQIPTGDKDPFALRRHALGVIRMLSENDLSLELEEMLQSVAGNFGSHVFSTGPKPSMKPQGSHATLSTGSPFNSNTATLVADFIYDRLAGSLREQGYTAQEVDAVVSQRPQRLGDIPKRLAAVRTFAGLPEAAALAAANKRIQNILKKTDAPSGSADPALMQEAAERELFEAVSRLAPQVASLLQNEDYTGALTQLAGVRQAVDSFFDSVMVMVDEPLMRNNRLALLKSLGDLMNQVADISKLAA